jgi:hypothetical protein
MCTTASTLFGIGVVCQVPVDTHMMYSIMITANDIPGIIEDTQSGGGSHTLHTKQVVEHIHSLEPRINTCAFLYMTASAHISQSVENFVRMWTRTSTDGPVAAVLTTDGHTVCLFNPTPGSDPVLFDPSTTELQTPTDKYVERLASNNQVDILLVYPKSNRSIQSFYDKL